MTDTSIIMQKKVIALLLGIFLLLTFVLFSREVKRGFLKSIDFNVTVKLQDKISPRFDQIMDDGAILIDPIVSSVIVLGLTGWVFVKTRGKRKLFAVCIPVAFVLLTMVEVYGKIFVPHAGRRFMIKNPTTIFPQFHVVQPYSYRRGMLRGRRLWE